MSDAESIVIRTLRERISADSRRARFLATMVPPVPPPTTKILIAFSYPKLITRMSWYLGATTCPARSVLLGLADLDVPDPVDLFIAEDLVADLVDPLRHIGAGTFVGRQQFEGISHAALLHVGDEFHQRPGAEGIACVDNLGITQNRTPENKRFNSPSAQSVSICPPSASLRKRVSQVAGPISASKSSCVTFMMSIAIEHGSNLASPNSTACWNSTLKDGTPFSFAISAPSSPSTGAAAGGPGAGGGRAV